MSWSDYMREHGTEEYAAAEEAVKPYTDQIAELETRIAKAAIERDYYKGAYERTLKGQREALDSALQFEAIARQAVEVLEKYVIEDCEREECASGLAFLSRPDVVKIGGGK